MLRRLLFLFWLAILPLVPFAQSGQEACGSSRFRELQEADLPMLAADQQAFDRRWAVQAADAGLPAPDLARQGPWPAPAGSLPVVFHMVHEGGPENLPDTTLQKAIAHLNQAFDAQSPFFPGSAQTGISFCLAARDPAGAAHPGITRDSSVLTNLNMDIHDPQLKAISPWPQTDYINIWVVREITSVGLGPAIRGYASLPSQHGTAPDGIVIEAGSTGDDSTFSRILIHEMGNYLGLYHTFQGGCPNDNCLLQGDQVCDTPPDNSNLAAPCNMPGNSCTTDADDPRLSNPFRPVAAGGWGDQADQHSNFMDYGETQCLDRFTEGQADRMRYSLQDRRISLLRSRACFPPCLNPVLAQFSLPQDSIVLGTSLNPANGSTGATQYQWYLGDSLLSTAANPVLTPWQPGSYPLILIAGNGGPECESRDTLLLTVSCDVQASILPPATLNPAPGSTLELEGQASGALASHWLMDLQAAGQGAILSQPMPAQGGFMFSYVACSALCCDTSDAYVQVGQCMGRNAQRWYFGNQIGLDFAQGTPHFVGDGQMTGFEGTVTHSSAKGEPMMYSNSMDAWNRQHSIFPNGSFLNGNLSSTQSSVLVPDPGHPDRLYMFTTGAQVSLLGYHIFDFRLENGLGDLSSPNNVLQLDACEKLATTRHANGRDAWVLAHQWSSDAFWAYLVRDTGLVTTPVVSTVGLPHAGNQANSYGAMKFSPDGSRLAVAIFQDGIYELFDFDALSGTLSHRLTATGYPNAYSMEFSPDGSLLYLAPFGDAYIYQMDLTAGSDSAILASSVPIACLTGRRASLQAAPDGRIYAVHTDETRLGVIRYPNVHGPDCGFVRNAIDLQGRRAQLGLPYCTYLAPVTEPVSIAGPDTLCVGDSSLSFHLTSQRPVHAIVDWEVDGQLVLSGKDSLYHHFGVAGPHLVVARQWMDCGEATDSLWVDIRAAAVDLGADSLPICAGDSLWLDAGPQSSYVWSDQSTQSTFLVTAPGTYWVDVVDAMGCPGSDTVVVVPCVSAEDPEAGGFLLYPNPNGGSFSLSWRNGQHYEKLEIVDAMGRRVMAQAIGTGQHQVQVEAALAHGVYLLLLHGEDRLEVLRFQVR